jgi:hypothetical protein
LSDLRPAFEVTASGRNLGAGCVLSETGARNECAGGAVKNAKEQARGLPRRPSFRSHRSDTLKTWNCHRRHTQTVARTSRIFAHRSRRPEMANETVRKTLGEKGCDARDCVEYRDLRKKSDRQSAREDPQGDLTANRSEFGWKQDAAAARTLPPHLMLLPPCAVTPSGAGETSWTKTGLKPF